MPSIKLPDFVPKDHPFFSLTEIGPNSHAFLSEYFTPEIGPFGLPSFEVAGSILPARLLSRQTVKLNFNLFSEVRCNVLRTRT